MFVPIFKFLFPKMTTVWPRIVLSKFCRHLEYCKNGRLTVIFLLSDAFVWVMFSKYNPNRTTNPNPQNPNSLHGKKYGTLHEFACHPCAGAMLIFSVSFQF